LWAVTGALSVSELGVGMDGLRKGADRWRLQ
jgi:hypothetical protein